MISRSRVRLALALATLLVLGGCSVLPKPAPPQATYDLGPPPGSPIRTLPPTLHLKDVTAPGWMDNTDMLYRLAYANDTRVRAYSRSRWVAPPASLFEQRLQAFYTVKAKSGSGGSTQGAGHEVALRLDRFEQIFTAPKIAHVELRLRASVYDSDGEVVAERTFSGREPCVTPDAQGGVKALSKLSDRIIRHFLSWVTRRPWAQGGQSNDSQG